MNVIWKSIIYSWLGPVFWTLLILLHIYELWLQVIIILLKFIFTNEIILRILTSYCINFLDIFNVLNGAHMLKLIMQWAPNKLRAVTRWSNTVWTSIFYLNLINHQLSWELLILANCLRTIWAFSMPWVVILAISSLVRLSKKAWTSFLVMISCLNLRKLGVTCKVSIFLNH